MSLHVLGHPMMGAVLREVIKGKLCIAHNFNVINFANNLIILY